MGGGRHFPNPSRNTRRSIFIEGDALDDPESLRISVHPPLPLGKLKLDVQSKSFDQPIHFSTPSISGGLIDRS
jgi:hypothetical protein